MPGSALSTLPQQLVNGEQVAGNSSSVVRDSIEMPARRTRAANMTWADPKSPEWDVIRVLNSDDCLAPDSLLKIPNPNYSYIDSIGKLKDPYKYAVEKQYVETHPTLAAHRRRGTATPAVELYYKDLPSDQSLPIAGKIQNSPDPRDNLPDPRGSAVRGAPNKSSGFASAIESLFPGLTSVQLTRSTLTYGAGFQEEAFHVKPSVNLLIPDHIKAILVDDWENVTKNLQLVPLPAAKPVSAILNDYLEFEKPRRQSGSAQADILDEVISGLKEYFEKCLGRILLYR